MQYENCKQDAVLLASAKLSGMKSPETSVNIKTIIIFFPVRMLTEKKEDCALWCLIDWAFWQAR